MSLHDMRCGGPEAKARATPRGCCETCKQPLDDRDNIVGRWCDDVCADRADETALGPTAAHCPHGGRICLECDPPWVTDEPASLPPEPAPPKVGDTVWLRGWGAGPWLLSSFCEGKARVSDMRGRPLYRDWLPPLCERVEFFLDMLTTEPPPPSPWTPTLIVRCVAGLAALGCSLAALVAYAAA